MLRPKVVLPEWLTSKLRFPALMIGLAMMSGCVAYVPYGDSYSQGYRDYGANRYYGNRHHHHGHRRDFEDH